MTSISAISAYSSATPVRPVHTHTRVERNPDDDQDKKTAKADDKRDTSTHGPAVKVTLSPEASLLLKKEKAATDKGT